jgi:hypothetical protein
VRYASLTHRVHGQRVLFSPKDTIVPWIANMWIIFTQASN